MILQEHNCNLHSRVDKALKDFVKKNLLWQGIIELLI